ncbi:MAG: hypothetical protein ABI651_12220 [Verrucomicrobiota bacterium]
MKSNCSWKIIPKHCLQIPWLNETPRPLSVTLHHAQTTFIFEARLIAALSYQCLYAR